MEGSDGGSQTDGNVGEKRARGPDPRPFVPRPRGRASRGKEWNPYQGRYVEKAGESADGRSTPAYGEGGGVSGEGGGVSGSQVLKGGLTALQVHEVWAALRALKEAQVSSQDLVHGTSLVYKLRGADGQKGDPNPSSNPQPNPSLIPNPNPKP